jgi:PmbA protein
MSAVHELLEKASEVLDLAKQAGVDMADVAATQSTDFEVKVADGKIVTLTQATTKGLGLRLFVDGRMGFCTTSDFSKAALQAVVGRGVAMAKEADRDVHNGLAPELVPGRIDCGPELDLFDPEVLALGTDQKIAMAHRLEQAARDTDPRVTKFRDSGVSTGAADTVLLTSNGVERTRRATALTVWCNPIAEHQGELQTEMWWDSKTHVKDLAAIECVGQTAARRAARMLGAKPVKTQDVPVVFEPELAAGLVAGMLGALNGDMVYKGASFLADKLGSVIAAKALTVVDDPTVRRSSASAPFDGEGLPTRAKNVVDAGVLTTFLYDSYTARKAGAKPTANARRGAFGLPRPGPFNFYVARGDTDPKEIIRGVKQGLFVTRGLGHGVNTVSGEYSRGAGGLWIEDGELTFPVQEVTIAGDFVRMLQDIDAIGSDWQLRGSTGAPTVRIARMTVSGRA